MKIKTALAAALFVLVAAAADAQNQERDGCEDNEKLYDCWTKFAPDATQPAPPASNATSAAKVATDRAERDADQGPTGVEVPSANVTTTADKMTNVLDVLGLLADSNENGVFGFNLNFLLPGTQQAKDNNLQLKALVNTQAEVWKGIENALPEDGRADLLMMLEDDIGDFDDVTFELTYRPVGAKIGRGFKQYRDRIASLFAGVETEVRRTSELGSIGAFMEALQAADLSSDELDDLTFEDIPEANRSAFKTQFIKAAKQAGAYQKGLQSGFRHYRLGTFDELVNNQPELQASLRYRARDNLTGPNETTLSVSYSHGLTNLNRFYAWQENHTAASGRTAPCTAGIAADPRRQALASTGASGSSTPQKDCLEAYRTYVNDSDRSENLQQANRFSFSLEYTEIDALDLSLPEGLDAVSLPESEKIMVQLAYGRNIMIDDDNDDGADKANARIDFAASYEDVSDDPMRQDRAIASVTLTRSFGDTDVPFGIVWASKPEFLPDVDAELSAHLGLRFSLGDKKKSKPP